MRVLSLQTLKIFSLCSHVLYVMLSPSDNALSSISYCIFQYIIFSIRYRFAPFVSTILTRHLNSNMRKPAILFCSMPVLYISWNQYNFPPCFHFLNHIISYAILTIIPKPNFRSICFFNNFGGLPCTQLDK